MLFNPILKEISVDFYVNNYVSVYAKQGDARSRCINIACTDHGKAISIDPELYNAYVRIYKSDNTCVFREAELVKSGEIYVVQVTLVDSILAVEGTHKMDLLILSKPTEDSNAPQISENGEVTGINTSGWAVLSTMPFYLIVIGRVLSSDVLESSDDFDAFVKALNRATALEQTVIRNEEIRNNKDAIREENEEIRKDNEATREKNENKRIKNENTRIENETARIEAYENYSAELEKLDDTIRNLKTYGFLGYNFGAENKDKIFKVAADGTACLIDEIRVDYDRVKEAVVISIDKSLLSKGEDFTEINGGSTEPTPPDTSEPDGSETDGSEIDGSETEQPEENPEMPGESGEETPDVSEGEIIEGTDGTEENEGAEEIEGTEEETEGTDGAEITENETTQEDMAE